MNNVSQILKFDNRMELFFKNIVLKFRYIYDISDTYMNFNMSNYIEHAFWSVAVFFDYIFQIVLCFVWVFLLNFKNSYQYFFKIISIYTK